MVEHHSPSRPSSPQSSVFEVDIASGSATSISTFNDDVCAGQSRLDDNPLMISTKPVIKRICCIGAGYVGGPTSAVIALQNPNIRVAVVDRDQNRIDRWNSRHLPVHEPGLYDVVRSARDGTQPALLPFSDTSTEPITLSAREPNLFFSSDIDEEIAQADLILLSVNTPTKTAGIGAGEATDMTALESATKTVARHAKDGVIVVEKSTVPCRTAQMIRDILDVYRPGVHFEILSNPEFLAEGTAIKDLLNPDRILIGSLHTASALAAADALRDIYRAWVDPYKIVTMNLWSSELAKLVANAMLAQRISSINTISAICERTGADVDEIAKGIGLDQRLGPQFLKAGIGFGGSCFKKDILSLVYLANSLDLKEVAGYWKSVLTINEFQRVRFVKRIVQKLNGTLAGKKVTILGYAFKKDTNDTRESPAIDVVKQLLQDRPRQIAIFDPLCRPGQIHDEIREFCGSGVVSTEFGPVVGCSDVYAACEDANAVVILTDWDQFRYPPLPVPLSAFHEGDQLHCKREVDHSGNVSESQVLELRERKRTVRLLSKLAIHGVDPLARFNKEPECPQDCTRCQRRDVKERVIRDVLDWRTIATKMVQPRWVFDGRGILDVQGMLDIGFRVESIGKSSPLSALNGELF